MMAKVYFNRLWVGTITYDAIPARYQTDVLNIGKGYVRDGSMTVVEFEQMYKFPYEA